MDYKMKLIRYYWSRPSSINEFNTEKGVFTEECFDNSVESNIRSRHKMCESEGIGRTISKIKIFNFEEER